MRNLPTAQSPAPRPPPHRRNRILFTIALFKFAKAGILIVGGTLALCFRNADLSRIAIHWVNRLRLDPHNRYVDWVLDHVALVHKRQIEMLVIGTFIYAILFSIEGVGLFLEKAWGEYLVIVEISLLVPVEVYAIAHKPDLLRTGLLLVNMLILSYLVHLRVQTHRRKKVAGR